MVHRVRRWNLLSAFLLCAVPGVAQSPVFTDGFEWGDVGEWSLSVPARCDVIRTFDRGLAPIAELHVAVSGNDSTGDGSPGSPFASIGGAVRSVWLEMGTIEPGPCALYCMIMWFWKQTF